MKQVVGFDFDGTIIKETRLLSIFNWKLNTEIAKKIREESISNTVVIITKRYWYFKFSIYLFTLLHKLPIESIYCTNRKSKFKYFKLLNVKKYYDGLDITDEILDLSIELILVKK